MQSHQGKNDDGYYDYGKEKAGAAANVGRAVILDRLHLQRNPVFIGIYRLMLSAVIGEIALNIRHQPYRPQVNNHNSHPD